MHFGLQTAYIISHHIIDAIVIASESVGAIVHCLKFPAFIFLRKLNVWNPNGKWVIVTLQKKFQISYEA